MDTRPPLWVRLIYNVIEWIDNHPLYLLPSRMRYWRFRLYDDYCLCERCEKRREKGRQRPSRRKVIQ